MTTTRDQRRLAAVALIAGAAVIMAGLGFTLLRGSIEVRGGDVLTQTPDSIVVRCLGPDVSLSVRGFEGDVTFTNCFPGSTLTGHDGDVQTHGSNVSCRVDGSRTELRLTAPTKEPFKFAVMSDSHGYSDVLSEALRQAEGTEFIVHCGDMTPSGKPSEYDTFQATTGSASTPILTTPGNHDIKLDGGKEYAARFGRTAYSFDYSGVRFAFVDSSDQVISEEEVSWLSKALQGAAKKVVVTHMPVHDPFGNNHTLDDASCERVERFVREEGVDAVFTGHIHAYSLTRSDGTDYLVTGGAGGVMVDGVHHVVIVTVDESGFSYEKVDLACPPSSFPHVEIIGKDGLRLNLTYDDLLLMDNLGADSSYENQYGNVAGQGHYRGVLVRDILGLVGGMAEGDLLTVSAVDGYRQEFGFLNAYPDEVWLELQGEMIISLEFDGVLAGDWADGPRIAMLPEDGLYSNSDCELTSYEGQGYWVYESAGARWARNVLTIEVGAGP